jgi:hypothetical protein
LVFVPASRRILSGFVSGVFSLLGLASIITRDTGRWRRRN